MKKTNRPIEDIVEGEIEVISLREWLLIHYPEILKEYEDKKLKNNVFFE